MTPQLTKVSNKSLDKGNFLNDCRCAAAACDETYLFLFVFIEIRNDIIEYVLEGAQERFGREEVFLEEVKTC